MLKNVHIQNPFYICGGQCQNNPNIKYTYLHDRNRNVKTSIIDYCIFNVTIINLRERDVLYNYKRFWSLYSVYD